MLQRRLLTFIFACLLMGYPIISVPIEYDTSESERELSYDFDTEQSQARYDPRLLSEELRDSRSTSQEGAAACYTAEVRYEHGEKVTRKDPCEVCLCVDGEIFCWWKKCDYNKRRKEIRKARQQKSSHHNRRKSSQKSQGKFKAMKYVPKNVLNFPQHLPAIRQYDFNQNETKSIFHTGIEESYLPKMTGRKKTLKMVARPTSRSSILADIPYHDGSMISGRREDINKAMPYSDSHRNSNHQQQQELQQEQLQQQRDKAIEQQHHQQGVLYEKAIINDDGVFVEKVNKINDISEESKRNNNNGIENTNSNSKTNNDSSYKESIQGVGAVGDGINKNDLNSNSNSNININNNIIQNMKNTLENPNPNSVKPLDFAENEKIQFVDVPLAKHYIITSSGSVENTDILASDNVLSQFRNGYSVVVESTSRTDANSTTRTGADVLSQDSSSSGLSDYGAASASIVTPAAAAQVPITTVTANVADVTAVMPPSSSLSASSSSSSSSLSQSVQSSGSPLSSLSQADASSLLSSPSLTSSSSLAYRHSQGDTSSSTSGNVTAEPPPQEQECVVMGTSYKIGTILPQDTGNCLQCICIEGASEKDSPRVTCSPHNCPPLVLPDLFDTTGY